MSFAKEILRGILWNHVGKILEYALMYVFSVLVARGLGAEGNGTYVTFFTVAQFLLLVSGLGFETALIRSANQYSHPQDYPRLRYLVRQLIRWRVLAVAVGVLLFCLLRLEILHFLSISESALRYFFLILFYVGLKSLVPLFLSLFVAQLNTRMASAISVSARALEVAAAFYSLSLGYGIEAILFIIIGGAAYSLIGCLMFAGANFWGRVEREDTRPVVALGMIFWINTIMAYILEKQGDIILLNTLLGDRKEVGYYDVSYGLVQVVVYGFTIGFSGVSLAAFSRLASSNTQMLGEAWKFSVNVIILLLLPALIFLAAHAEVLIPAIYSREYERSVGLFQLFVLFQITARLFGSGVNADVLLSVNRVRVLVGFGILAGLLNILLDVLLIPSFRAYGAVLATGVANTAVVAMSALYIVKKFSISLSVGFWLKVVAISILSAYVGKILLHPTALPTILLSGLIYVFLWGLLAFALKPFAREDIEMMKKFNFRVSEWAAHFAWT